MKKFFSYFAVSMTMILGLAVSSCSTDNCKNVDCGTNGTCDAADGKCLCNAGYELGTTSKKCDVESRAKFVGTWTGKNPSAANNHDIAISTSSTAVTKVRITNFGNYDCTSGTPLAITADVSSTALSNFASDGCTTIAFSGTPTATINTTATPNTLTMVYSIVLKNGSSTNTDTTVSRTVVYTK